VVTCHAVRPHLLRP